MPWSRLAPDAGGMETTTRSTWTNIAAVLLGITAAGAAAFGILIPVAGLLGAELLGGSLGTAAVVLTVGVGVISFAFAGTAAFAARAVYIARPIGSLVGIGVGIIVVLGAAVASVSGGWHPALTAAYVIGGGTVGSLALAMATDTARA